MNKELFDKLDKINDTMFDMDIKVKRINEMLEELIAALHNYDDGLEMFDNEPKRTPPCVGHDAASWEQEAELNKRIDIIGQNGNTGEHYESMSELNDEFFGKIIDDGFDDNNKRVVGKDKDKSNNTQPKQKQYYKNNRSKRNGNKKSAIVEHQKHPPHKH